LESHFLYAQSCGENISAATELVQINASAELSAAFLARHFAGDVMEAGRASSNLSIGFAWLVVSAGTGATGSGEAVHILSRALKCERLVPKDTMLPAVAGYALYLGSEFILQDILANEVPGKTRFLEVFNSRLCRGAGMRLSIPKDIFDGSGRRYHERMGKPYWLTGDPETRPPDGVVDKDYVLRIAAGWGSLADVKLLVWRFRANVNTTDHNGETALLKACRAGHYHVVEWLVKEAGALASIASRNGVTPLHWLDSFPASSVGNVTNLLCSAGADVNAIIPDTLPNPDGSEGRYWFFRGPPLMRVVATGNVEAVKALLRHGANPLTRRTGDFEMPISSLQFAVKRARVDVLKVMVDKLGSHILWERQPSGTRLLSLLLTTSQKYLAKIHGEAYEEALLSMFTFIWSRADAVERQLLSMNALGETAIQVAVKNGNFILVKCILDSCPAHPLHLKRLVATLGLQTAIPAGHLAMMRYLLDAGGDALHCELSVDPNANGQFGWYPIETSWSPASILQPGDNSIHLCAFAGHNSARMAQEILHRALPSSRWDQTPEHLRKHDKINCSCVRPPSDDPIVDTRNDEDETPFFLALRQQEYAMAYVLHNAGANVNVVVRGLPLVEHALKWNNAHRVLRFLIATCWGCVRMTRADGTELRAAMIAETAQWPIEEASELIQFVQEHAYPGWTWDQEIEDAIASTNEAVVDLLLGARRAMLPRHTTPLHLYGAVQTALVVSMQANQFDASTPQKQAKSLLGSGIVTKKMTQIIKLIRESYPETALGSSAGLDILRIAKLHCEKEIRWRAARYAKGLVSRTKLETELNQQLFPWLVSLHHNHGSEASNRVQFGREVERFLREAAGTNVTVMLDATNCLLQVKVAQAETPALNTTSDVGGISRVSGIQDYRAALGLKRMSLRDTLISFRNKSGRS
jgi:ankyrin repeat protein